MTPLPSHEDGFNRGDQTFHMALEQGGTRTPVETLDEELSTVYPTDIPMEGALDALRPTLKRVHKYNYGNGRKSSCISEQGFDNINQETPFHLQTSRFIAAAHGKVLTIGEDTGITGTISSGAGTFVITTGETLVENKHVGHYVEITSGTYTGYKYHIKSHTTGGVITLTIRTPATGFDGSNFKIVGGPFKHYIRRGRTIPTWSGHHESPNEITGQSIYIDSFGILIPKVVVSVGLDGDAEQAVSFIAPKSKEGVAIANLPQDLPCYDLFKWIHHAVVKCEYNGTPVIDNVSNSGGRVESVEHTIENNAAMKKTQGDPNATYKNAGTVDYNLKIFYYPGGEYARLFYDLINTPLKDYLGDLKWTFELIDPDYAQRDDLSYWDRYIKFVYTKTHVNVHKWGTPTPDDYVYGTDAEFKLLPEGELEIESQDNYGIDHYEGSGAPTTGITP